MFKIPRPDNPSGRKIIEGKSQLNCSFKYKLTSILQTTCVIQTNTFPKPRTKCFIIRVPTQGTVDPPVKDDQGSSNHNQIVYLCIKAQLFDELTNVMFLSYVL